MTKPRPGQPVRGSKTGRPVMVLLDVLGRRWALRILWELTYGPLSFRALREQCDDVSPSVLNARIAELRELSLVASSAEGYSLTAQARSLAELLLPLDAWAQRWARELGRQAPTEGKRASRKRDID